ncbi:MAG TPA: response regulator [Coleofasciculaceae cyanobacterium]
MENKLCGLRILVVENDPYSAELFKFILEELAEATVVTVASAGEALLKLERYQPDILVSNLVLPELDGYSLLDLVRTYEKQRGRSIVAVAVTLYSRDVNLARIQSAGFQTYISKPIDPELFVAKLASLVEFQKVS